MFSVLLVLALVVVIPINATEYFPPNVAQCNITVDISEFATDASPSPLTDQQVEAKARAMLAAAFRSAETRQPVIFHMFFGEAYHTVVYDYINSMRKEHMALNYEHRLSLAVRFPFWDDFMSRYARMKLIENEYLSTVFTRNTGYTRAEGLSGYYMAYPLLDTPQVSSTPPPSLPEFVVTSDRTRHQSAIRAVWHNLVNFFECCYHIENEYDTPVFFTGLSYLCYRLDQVFPLSTSNVKWEDVLMRGTSRWAFQRNLDPFNIDHGPFHKYGWRPTPEDKEVLTGK